MDGDDEQKTDGNDKSAVVAEVRNQLITRKSAQNNALKNVELAEGNNKQKEDDDDEKKAMNIIKVPVLRK